MDNTLVLFGAGDCGRSIARVLNAKKIPFVFVDNDPSKQKTVMLGVPVFAPEFAAGIYKELTWVVSIGKPFRSEVAAQIRGMGIEPEMPWEYLDMKYGLPPDNIRETLFPAIYDVESKLEFNDQCIFRRDRDYDAQFPCENLLNIYFPDFITHRDDEHFVDCGAADGDTVREFVRRWKSFGQITAFEPDKNNYAKLIYEKKALRSLLRARLCGVSDYRKTVQFLENGDYSSRTVDSKEKNSVSVNMVALDEEKWRIPPTYIKFDIEGSELAALWGARKLIKEHSPVLAICAYHESDHLWQIPLLINAIQPSYKLVLRRYSPGSMDLVWYAVPPERIKA